MANKFLPCMSMLSEVEISILSNWTASESGWVAFALEFHVSVWSTLRLAISVPLR